MATPFSQLLGLAPHKPPPTRSVQVVVAGRRIDAASEVDALVVDAERDDDLQISEARRLAEEARKAKRRAADKRYRESAAGRATQQAWRAANPDRMREYRAKHQQRQGDAWAAKQAASHQRWYWSDPEAARKKARDYYHANKERIRAQARAREAAKQAQLQEQE